jgi:hypothetical protein
MRRRRARTVWIMASVVFAVGALALIAPSSRLWAQKPGGGDPVEASSPQIPEIPPIAAPQMPPPLSPEKLPPAKEPAAETQIPVADPEAAAVAFVERSQKEADEAIRALGKEAEALRARLQKVEAGLARWESVKEALADHGGRVDAGAVRPAWRSRGSIRPGVERAVGVETDPQPKILTPVLPGGSSSSRIDPPTTREPSDKPDTSLIDRRPPSPAPEKGRVVEASPIASETTSPPLPPALPDDKSASPLPPARELPK